MDRHSWRWVFLGIYIACWIVGITAGIMIIRVVS